MSPAKKTRRKLRFEPRLKKTALRYEAKKTKPRPAEPATPPDRFRPIGGGFFAAAAILAVPLLLQSPPSHSAALGPARPTATRDVVDSAPRTVSATPASAPAIETARPVRVRSSHGSAFAAAVLGTPEPTVLERIDGPPPNPYEQQSAPRRR